MPWRSPLVIACNLIVVLNAFANGENSIAQPLAREDDISTFQSQLNHCPASCLGKTPEHWTVYSSFERLSQCNLPMLFDLAIHTPIKDNSKTVLVRACTTAVGSKQEHNPIAKGEQVDTCSELSVQTKVPLHLTRDASISTSETSETMKKAFDGMKDYTRRFTTINGCREDSHIMFSDFKGSVVGIYAGRALESATIPLMIDRLVNEYNEPGFATSRMLAQICGDNSDMEHTAGVVVATEADIGYVQSALLSWNKGECAKNAGKDDNVSWTQDIVIQKFSLPPARAVIADINGTNSTSMTLGQVEDTLDAFQTQAEGKYCTKRQIAPGDSCASLAKACKISLADFFKYNGVKGDGNDWCRKLQAGKNICCSSGSSKPLSESNGNCYTYTIKAGDDCSRIGTPWDLTSKEIEDFNNKVTWGWRGCPNLSIGLKICLSKGSPPMPAEVSNAICGPQKPGTVTNGTIKDASSLAKLNPCPLNSCCNIWGQCGIDSLFCTKAEGPTGNPGTSPPGVNGCISNCGTDIVNNDQPPSEFQRIGYYESFNWERPCLNMRSEWSNTQKYTHMHWAFADIKNDISVYINDTYHQWEGFMGLKDVKKIISLGGWGFSTGASTYEVLRDAMTPAKRNQFVSNIVSLVKETGVDGIDFDWEYPGAPDIPGIPKGLPSDGPNYLATLGALRKALPAKCSLSIAVPASYWYLRPFPIREMSEIVDYIVYMSYDLHGQWDVGNGWAMSGCPSGNCLRSHVNQTEVMLALSMITKAGVKSNKIFVGESSYGRSFRMAKAGCSGPQCQFTGGNGQSAAEMGRCTSARGYISNAEIKEIIDKSAGSAKVWFDNDTASDYLVYNDLEWVAYMSEKTKESRRDKWKKLNFRGTVDWAVDLQEFNVADTVGPKGEYNQSSCIQVFDNMIWDWVNPSIEAAAGCTNILQPSPLPKLVTLTAYTTITLQSGTLLSSTIVSAPFSISEINYQPFTFDVSDISSGQMITYNPTPRITPNPITIRIPNGWTVTGLGATPSGKPLQSSIIGLPKATSTTSSVQGAASLLPITWLPTVSYKIPSILTPKIPAPTDLPDDDEHPVVNPPPVGVTDCKDDKCTKGQDCENDDCLRGGDCLASNCVEGGKCKGKKCLRGGHCLGPRCLKGGPCEGTECDSGGFCSGTSCSKGGPCRGEKCTKAGGCAKTIFGDCNPGECTGKNCFPASKCFGAQCNKVTIKPLPKGNPPKGTPVKPPKPTCLFGCPKLPECPLGVVFCNEPCGLLGCPPDREPTAKACTTLQTGKDCTEFVSSTQAQTKPTTSWSTTTRTICETILDCDVTDFTMTTTISTTETPDPTVIPDYIQDSDLDFSADEALLSSIGADQDAFFSMLESSSSVTSTTTSISLTSSEVSPQPTQTPAANCAYSYDLFLYRFWISNMVGSWVLDDEGEGLKHALKGCGAVTGWEWFKRDDGTREGRLNLPLFIKEGCVERAIASAGGPKLECREVDGLKRDNVKDSNGH